MLVLRVQAGETRAFEILYRAYQPSLLRFAYRLSGDRQLALDAVQDAWILTERTIDELDNPAMFRARVFKAVRWRTYDHMRRRGVPHLPLEAAGEVMDASRETLATRDQIVRLVDTLPDFERQAIYLFYLEDMMVTEIADVLDVPAGTVKSRLNRARARLRQQLEGEEE
nr:sigma-70 family RNA polymerase sigma factor [Kordiimonas marina]